MKPVVAAVLLAAAVAAQAACDPPLAGKEVWRSASARYGVAFRPVPSPIRVGEPFAIEFALCREPGAPAPEILSVDAHMPAHRHGMNYRPTVKPLGDGSYRSEGWLFHMPGAWEFVFELRGGGRSERLTHGMTIE